MSFKFVTVEMTKTEKGSEDGRFVKEYQEGKTYDLPESLAKIFIDLKVAKEVEKPAPKEPKGKEKGKDKE